MRFMLVLVVVLTGTASADKRIVDMTPGFERELASCEMQEGGLSIVLGKARTYVATNPPDKVELAKDVERLAQGYTVVTAYCAELRAMVAFLKGHAASAYKTVQKDLHTRDAAVRKLRPAGKKQIDEIGPITRKLIPIVTARVPQFVERKQTGKFPSGRVVELPSVTGAWKLGGNFVTDIAEYSTAGVTATTTTRPFSNATCDQQRKLFVAKAGDEPIADLELSPAAKAIAVQWAWRYVRRDQTPHLMTMMCVPVGTGGYVAVSDMTPTDQLALADDMTKLMVTMLALQLPKPN